MNLVKRALVWALYMSVTVGTPYVSICISQIKSLSRDAFDDGGAIAAPSGHGHGNGGAWPRCAAPWSGARSLDNFGESSARSSSWWRGEPPLWAAEAGHCGPEPHLTVAPVMRAAVERSPLAPKSAQENGSSARWASSTHLGAAARLEPAPLARNLQFAPAPVCAGCEALLAGPPGRSSTASSRALARA